MIICYTDYDFTFIDIVYFTKEPVIMEKLLSQEEIDSLVDALRAIKGYSDDEEISEDVLNSQVVLSQSEIDKLIESLNNGKKEIDELIDNKEFTVTYRYFINDKNITKLASTSYPVKYGKKADRYPINSTFKGWNKTKRRNRF